MEYCGISSFPLTHSGQRDYYYYHLCDNGLSLVGDYVCLPLLLLVP